MPRLIASAVMAVLLITVFAPAGGTVPAAAQAPDVEVAADAIIVDELGDGFIPRGAGWRDGEGGYGDHHYWQRAVSPRTGRVGTWRVTLPEAGPYRIEAMVPLRHATTKAARYLIGTADGIVIRTANQSRTRGTWLSLGTYDLGATAEVRLSARTADARAGRLVAFDAMRFVSVAAPPPPPDPPVISNVDVEPTHDRAVVRFSLDAKGPARTEYREAGAVEWRLGANDTSYDYADHRQVITGLKPETGYELRVIATNLGGETVSPITRFTTPAPPPPPSPVISRIDVTPAEFQAVVTFSLDAKGPASTEYRERGASAWLLGAEEASSTYRDHRQVIKGLRPETSYELRIIATNAGGRTVSDIVPFKTRQRTVDCAAGGDLQAAIDAAKDGDTLRIRGRCSFESISKDLTLKGDSADASAFADSGLVGTGASVDFIDLWFGHDGFRNHGGLLLDGVQASFMRALDNAVGATLTLRRTSLDCDEPCVNNDGTFTSLDSVIRAGIKGHAIYNRPGAALTLRDTTLLVQLALASSGTATLRGVTMSGVRLDDLAPISNRAGGVMTIEGSEFTDNRQVWQSSTAASALENAGELTVTDSAFLRNEGGLGAIVNTGDITLARVTFSDNVPADCVGC